MARTAFFAATVIAFLVITLPVQAGVINSGHLAWADLAPEQKEILAPLAQDWDHLENSRRKKWLGIAQRYPSMNPEKQQRIQENMKHWVKLTPEERKKVREKYKHLQKASPEKRQEIKLKWLEYKELPEAEKKRLAEKARQHPTSNPAWIRRARPKLKPGISGAKLLNAPSPALTPPSVVIPATDLPETPANAVQPAPIQP